MSTARRVHAGTAATLLVGVSACEKVSCSHGTPGVKVVLRVEAVTAAGAYGADLVLLVAGVLPRLQDPLLTDVLISPDEQFLTASEHSARSVPATGRDGAALV